MKRYRVTKKHKFIIANHIIEKQTNENYHSILIKGVHLHSFTRIELHCWAKKGWIEEIQEPEFTKGDLLGFALEFINSKTIYSFIDINELLNQWIKNNK